MFRNKFTTFGSVTGTLIVIGLAIPIFILAGMPLLSSAQNNQCLPQDATISAMQVVLVQSTLSSLNYQATITTLTQHNDSASRNDTSTNATATPVVGLPFNDNFVDNSHGWDLRQYDNGGASLTGGQLLITLNSDSGFYEQVPGLNVSDFYAELEGKIVYSNTTNGFGFMIADSTSSKYDIIELDRNGGQNNAINLYENDGKNTKKFQIPTGNDVFGQTITFGLESKGGSYTVYINSQNVTTVQFTPQGTKLYIYVQGRNYGAASFSNISVRQAK